MIIILVCTLFILLISCADRIFLPAHFSVENRGSYQNLMLPDGETCREILLINSSQNLFMSLSATKERGSSQNFKIWQIPVADTYDVYKIIQTESALDTIFTQQEYFNSFNSELTLNRRDELNLLEITILDVKQGDCIIIDPPKENISIVDGGYGSFGYQSWQGNGQPILADYLLEQSVDSIKYLVETHPDIDHRGGLEDLENGGFSYESYLSVSNQIASKGDTLSFGEKCRASILNLGCPPALVDAEDENEKSIVLWLNYYNFDLLLTGDATIDNENILLEENSFNGESLEIIKAPHHGSKYSNSSLFLATLQPYYSLISAGKDNPYNHPHEETLMRYRENDISFFNTADFGTIKVLTDGDFLQVFNEE